LYDLYSCVTEFQVCLCNVVWLTNEHEFSQIRDGPSADSTLINQLCGSEVPQPVSTTQNQMWIKFVSDGSDHNRGFQASYAASSASKWIQYQQVYKKSQSLIIDKYSLCNLSNKGAVMVVIIW
jgi:hypothetical protein